jgi:hypothetical protein
MDGAKTVVAVVAVVALNILGPARTAYAGSPSRPILNPGTLLLLTTGFAGLS